MFLEALRNEADVPVVRFPLQHVTSVILRYETWFNTNKEREECDQLLENISIMIINVWITPSHQDPRSVDSLPLNYL